MTYIARVTDIGQGDCSSHGPATTIFMNGANSVIIEGQPACIIDITKGNATCGDETLAIEGSASVFFEGKAAHCVGHRGVFESGGEYIVMTGANSVTVGNDGITYPSKMMSNVVHEPAITPSATQLAKYNDNRNNVAKYNTTNNIANGVGDHPEFEDDVPVTASSAVNPNPDCGGQPKDIGKALDDVLAESKQGAWRETGSNKNIEKLYANVGFPNVKGDKTAWCAAFTGSMLKNNCYKFNKSLAAGSYTGYGNPVPGGITNAKKGDVVVFHRDEGTGHVAFYYGPGPSPGTFYVVGGNQGGARENGGNVTLSLRHSSDLKPNGVQRPY